MDFIHRTVECTKAGLGLKFFAVLGTLGEKGLSELEDIARLLAAIRAVVSQL